MPPFIKFAHRFIFILPLILAALFNTSNAAEIKENKSFRHIVIEGKIESGDYEKVLDKILEKGITYRTIYLASAGGNANEAIKIGRLIRNLNYSTEVGVKFNERNFCDKNIKQENCICASACPLIYLGGVKRFGDALAVHRIYLNHDSLKNLSLEESKSLSKYLEIATDEYLKEMGAPSSFIEKMSSATSDRLVNLEKDYVEKNLTGYIKGYDEALIAKCGSSENAFNQILKNKKNDKEYSNFKNILDCQQSELRFEVERKYFDTIKSAIQVADVKNIPKNGVLAYLKANPINDVVDLLGKPSADGLKLLAMFGVGDGYKTGGFKFNDEVIIFNGSIRILFDAKSTIHSIDLSFFKSDNEDSNPYKGKFISGLTTKSEPKDFVSALGAPFKSGCVEASGVCMMWFNNSRFSANVGFEADRKTPRFISINKANYYSK